MSQHKSFILPLAVINAQLFITQTGPWRDPLEPKNEGNEEEVQVAS